MCEMLKDYVALRRQDIMVPTCPTQGDDPVDSTEERFRDRYGRWVLFLQVRFGKIGTR